MGNGAILKKEWFYLTALNKSKLVFVMYLDNLRFYTNLLFITYI